MRILQVAPAYFPAIAIGGPIYSMLALEEILVAEGHAVDTLTTHLGLGKVARRERPAGSEHRSPAGGKVIYQRFYGYPNFTFSPTTLAWLWTNVLAYDLVLLHGIWNFPIAAAAVTCRMRRVRYLVFPHGTLSVDAVGLRAARAKAVMWRLYVREMLARADRVVFTTSLEETKARKFAAGAFKGVVVPNVVNAAEFRDLPAKGTFRARHGIPTGAEVLIHYGRVARVKGIVDTVRALKAVRARYPDVKFVIAGGDEAGCRREVEAAARDCGVAECLLFTGLLQRHEGLEALVDADLFVLPSKSENFGMAAVEAMLCGLPVLLSSGVGIASEVHAADAGAVVEMGKGEGVLGEAILGLLANKRSLSAMGLRGRRFATHAYDAAHVRPRVRAMLEGT